MPLNCSHFTLLAPNAVISTPLPQPPHAGIDAIEDAAPQDSVGERARRRGAARQRSAAAARAVSGAGQLGQSQLAVPGAAALLLGGPQAALRACAGLAVAEQVGTYTFVGIISPICP